MLLILWWVASELYNFPVHDKFVITFLIGPKWEDKFNTSTHQTSLFQTRMLKTALLNHLLVTMCVMLGVSFNF